MCCVVVQIREEEQECKNSLLYIRCRAYMDFTLGYIGIIKNENCKWHLQWGIGNCAPFSLRLPQILY